MGMNPTKLKTNLRLAINRLKLIGKKKTELTQKSRREIADFIANNKEDRARIKVEQIIREDYYVEAFELLEMFCDLLLARFGLIEQMKSIDKGLEEAINSLIWATPRLQADIPELKIISDQLTYKYGKPYAEACRENKFDKVNEKLLHKLSVLTPPKLLVEQYMVEIAKSHNIKFLPDANVMMSEQAANAEALLIDYQQNKPGPTGGAPSGGSGSGWGGGGGAVSQTPAPLLGFEQVETRPQVPSPQPFNYPNIDRNSAVSDYEAPNQARAGPLPEKQGAPLADPLGGGSGQGVPTAPPAPPPYSSVADFRMPTPPSDSLLDFMAGASTGVPVAPPRGSAAQQGPGQAKKKDEQDDDFDFDDLNRRFEELKKKR